LVRPIKEIQSYCQEAFVARRKVLLPFWFYTLPDERMQAIFCFFEISFAGFLVAT